MPEPAASKVADFAAFDRVDSAEIRQCPDYRKNATLADGRDRSSCSPTGEPVSELGCRLGTEGAFCQLCNSTVKVPPW